MRFFFFGTLRDREILEAVIGRPFPGPPFPPARLPGHRLERMARETFPLLIAAPDAAAPGVVVEGLVAADVERIRFFESVEYEPQPREIELESGGRLDCLVFAATAAAGLTGESWRYEDWLARHKARELREARLWMAFHGHLPVEQADRLWNEAVAAGRAIEDLVAEVTGLAASVPLSGRGS